MDSLLEMVLNTAQNSILQDWGNEVIAEVAKDTEKQVTDQLGYNPLN